MHILAQLPPDFWVIVVVIFGGIFMFVLVSLADAQATGGWGSFAKRYPALTRLLATHTVSQAGGFVMFMTQEDVFESSLLILAYIFI
jgi:hypothetical protein